MSLDTRSCTGCACSAGDPTDLTPATGASRRSVLRASAGAVAGLAAVSTLAACGDDEAAEGEATPASTGGSDAGATGDVLTTLADVPVGGALAVSDGAIIVAQPTAGSVVAFDSKCPHQGCKVVVGDGVLTCPCHNSTFDPLTGELAADNAGPATAGLAPVTITLDGDNVVTA